MHRICRLRQSVLPFYALQSNKNKNATAFQCCDVIALTIKNSTVLWRHCTKLMQHLFSMVKSLHCNKMPLCRDFTAHKEKMQNRVLSWKRHQMFKVSAPSVKPHLFSVDTPPQPWIFKVNAQDAHLLTNLYVFKIIGSRSLLVLSDSLGPKRKKKRVMNWFRG